MAFYFEGTLKNRRKALDAADKAAKIYKIGEEAKKNIKKTMKALKGKKPDYAYRKFYA